MWFFCWFVSKLFFLDFFFFWCVGGENLTSCAQITLISQSFHVCPPSPVTSLLKKKSLGHIPSPNWGETRIAILHPHHYLHSKTGGQWGSRPSFPYPQGTIGSALHLLPKGRASTPVRKRTSSPEHMINLALGSSLLPWASTEFFGGNTGYRHWDQWSTMGFRGSTGHEPQAFTPFHTNMAPEGSKAQAHRQGIRRLHKLHKSTWISGFIEVWRSSMDTTMVCNGVVDDGDSWWRSNPESEPFRIFGPPPSFPRARGIWQEAGFQAESASA